MSNADDVTAEGDSSLLRELAHELRDALSPLASSADLARLRNFDPEASRLLAEKVERGLRRALALLDAFVLAEQCERGTLALRTRAAPLQEVLDSARRQPGTAARCVFEASAEGLTIWADPGRSAQVLAAVLEHAAELARHGQPVEVRTAGSATQPEIRVRATLDPANRPAQGWFASYRGGDGRMALRTARRIMCLQGGALELSSDNPGEFELVMRFAAQPVHPEEQHQPAAQPRRPGPAAGRTTERILIVEDSAEVRRAYREALTALGYTVLEAADAEQALQALETTAPDVALIDIHLPRMNGYRLAQSIRARTGTAIYLVMLSGMTLDDVTRELAHEAGFDDCLDKMAGPSALRELLEAGAGPRGGS